MRVLIICGHWSEDGGHPSKIMEDALRTTKLELIHFFVVNGGIVSYLQYIIDDDVLRWYDAVIWMPNIDNEEQKYLQQIKQKHPKLLLVSSKNAYDKEHSEEYTEFDFVGRMLASRSNLGIFITKEEECSYNPLGYNFSLLDPLGNSFYSGKVMSQLLLVLHKRVEFILSLTRVASRRETPDTSQDISFQIDEDFLAYVNVCGNEFTKYVNAVNPKRFLGNVSTRCMSGFPSCRTSSSLIAMSRRNVEKGCMTEKDFVPVQCSRLRNGSVVYFGESGCKPPSVDTPAHVDLYALLPKINYMMHGHVYIEDAPMTDTVLPCGSLEEVEEILDVIGEKYTEKFAINLKGHGCIIGGGEVADLKGYQFMSRPFPEEVDI